MTKTLALTPVIDQIVAELTDDDAIGVATPEMVHLLLLERHGDLIRAQRDRLASIGEMAQIRSRLRALERDDENSKADGQLQLDLPHDLRKIIGKIITCADGGAGPIVYRRLDHPETTVGHLRSHYRICDANVLQCTARRDAVGDIVARCEGQDDAVPLRLIFGTA